MGLSSTCTFSEGKALGFRMDESAVGVDGTDDSVSSAGKPLVPSS